MHPRDPATFDDQPLRRHAQAHLDVAHPHILEHDLEQPCTRGRATHIRQIACRLKARHLVHVHEPETVGARKRIISAGRPHGRGGTDLRGEAAHERLHLRHAVRQGAQHRRRCRAAAIGRQQIGERLRRVSTTAHPAGRRDGYAAGLGLLVDQQHPCAGIMGCDGRHAAGIAEADHHHIERLAHASIAPTAGHRCRSRKWRISAAHTTGPRLSSRWPSLALTPRARKMREATILPASAATPGSVCVGPTE